MSNLTDYLSLKFQPCGEPTTHQIWYSVSMFLVFMCMSKHWPYFPCEIKFFGTMWQFISDATALIFGAKESMAI
jgi:hypothetical protein